MAQEIIVITGANSGIGKATAIALAKRRGTIVMVCRNQERGEAARKDIIKESSNQEVFLELCDLTSHESIKACSARIQEQYPYIDILINNAGGIFGEHKLTVDGLEQTFGLNHMGYFLLTHYMLDLVSKGRGKRIVNVASLAHKMAPAIPWGDLQLTKIKYRQFTAYSLSKLYNIYFTQYLAQQLLKEGTGITVNCLHPGTVYTGFGNSGSKFFSKLVKIGGPLLAKPEDGAKTSIYLATSPDVANSTGTYYAHCKKARITKQAQNFVNAQRLWEKSMELAGFKTYGVLDTP